MDRTGPAAYPADPHVERSVHRAHPTPQDPVAHPGPPVEPTHPLTLPLLLNAMGYISMGHLLGVRLGALVGRKDDIAVGTAVGMCVGVCDGPAVGLFVGTELDKLDGP